MPSDKRLQVIGVFNPTFFAIEGRRGLLVRVDERPRVDPDGSRVSDGRSSMRVARVDVRNDRAIELIDVRVPAEYSPEHEPILPESSTKADGSLAMPDLLLSYISHIRVADLSSRTVSATPFLFPSDSLNEFGCEDPRAVTIGGALYVTYTGVSRFGATGWIGRLSASGVLEKTAAILGPDYKHCVLFPERVGDSFCMLSRPLTRTYLGTSGIWAFRSGDLLHWGQPAPVMMPRPGRWDSKRVGPATTPLLMPQGWLVFYYGVDEADSYHVSAALLDRQNPTTVLRRMASPVLSPTCDWERNGRRADTVFVCGHEVLSDGEVIRLYYGAADTVIGAAEVSTRSLLDTLMSSPYQTE